MPNTDAFIVVRVASSDVAKVRRAIHDAASTSDVVFRPNPSPFNFGIELYDQLDASVTTLLARAHAAKEHRAHS